MTRPASYQASTARLPASSILPGTAYQGGVTPFLRSLPKHVMPPLTKSHHATTQYQDLVCHLICLLTEDSSEGQQSHNGCIAQLFSTVSCQERLPSRRQQSTSFQKTSLTCHAVNQSTTAEILSMRPPDTKTLCVPHTITIAPKHPIEDDSW